MKTPSLEFATILRKTARRLESGAAYNWCHMGRCNCGHIAQTITNFSPAEIHEMALLKAGDWKDQSIDHCAATGYTIDHIIEMILSYGLSREDLAHIERLSDQKVLMQMSSEQRAKLDYRKRDDVIFYMRTWADLIENTLIDLIDADQNDLEPASNMNSKSIGEVVLV